MTTPRITFNEKTSGQITGQIVDEDDVGIPGTSFDVLFLSIYMRGDASLTLRSSDDLLADPNFTIDASGNFTWDVRPHDTSLIDTDPDDGTQPGSSETHVAYLEFGWNAAATFTLTSPFVTTLNSRTVTVNHTSHGLSVNDHVYFRPTTDVGGLDLGGIYVVKSVPTADSYTIEHRSAATSADTGGGSTEVFHNGEAQSSEIILITKAVDPV